LNEKTHRILKGVRSNNQTIFLSFQSISFQRETCFITFSTTAAAAAMNPIAMQVFLFLLLSNLSNFRRSSSYNYLSNWCVSNFVWLFYFFLMNVNLNRAFLIEEIGAMQKIRKSFPPRSLELKSKITFWLSI